MSTPKSTDAERKTPGRVMLAAMEEKGISRSDLAKILGSRGRVSDLLNDKREPTLREIKTLRLVLGVVADDLISDDDATFDPSEPDWSKFPLKEMAKRTWIPDTPRKKENAKAAITGLAVRVGCPNGVPGNMAFRGGVRGARNSDPLATTGWILGARLIAQKQCVATYTGGLDEGFLFQLVRHSAQPQGILAAQQFLSEHGVKMIIVPHLKKTYLDGAVFFMNGTPVIVLTLRYDRMDSAWFTLLHEAAHLALGHVSAGDGGVVILDDFEAANDSAIEEEADALATNTIIPPRIWGKYGKRLNSGSIACMHAVAEELGVHPSLVAGQIRHKRKDYRILSQHVGSKMVRRLFPEAFPVTSK